MCQHWCHNVDVLSVRMGLTAWCNLATDGVTFLHRLLVSNSIKWESFALSRAHVRHDKLLTPTSTAIVQKLRHITAIAAT